MNSSLHMDFCFKSCWHLRFNWYFFLLNTLYTYVIANLVLRSLCCWIWKIASSPNLVKTSEMLNIIFDCTIQIAIWFILYLPIINRKVVYLCDSSTSFKSDPENTIIWVTKHQNKAVLLNRSCLAILHMQILDVYWRYPYVRSSVNILTFTSILEFKQITSILNLIRL